MTAIEDIRNQLLPLVDSVTTQLQDDGDPGSASWFLHLRAALEAAQAEEDLLIIFMERLGPTGPLANSADFSAMARARLDALLARAQDVAFTFSADGDPH